MRNLSTVSKWFNTTTGGTFPYNMLNTMEVVIINKKTFLRSSNLDKNYNSILSEDN